MAEVLPAHRILKTFQKAKPIDSTVPRAQRPDDTHNYLLIGLLRVPSGRCARGTVSMLYLFMVEPAFPSLPSHCPSTVFTNRVSNQVGGSTYEIVSDSA